MPNDPNASTAHLNTKIPAHDGGAFGAYISMPVLAEGEKAPAIIMIQEIFGVNKEMRDKCDEMAGKGYIAIAPDLFWRIERGIQLTDSDDRQLNKAFNLYNDFDIQNGIEDLETALGFMRNHKSCNGLVGCVGYCLGGFLAVAMAVETDIDAAVSYYGVNLPNLLKRSSDIKKPLIMHIASEDEFVPPEDQKTIIDTMENHAHANTYLYEGVNHAFARGQGTHYNANAAGLANERTEEFLRTNLKQAQAAA